MFHRGFDAFAVDERGARFVRLRACWLIRSKPFHHRQYAGAVGGHADVVAHVKRAGCQMFPRQLRQIKPIRPIGDQKAESS